MALLVLAIAGCQPPFYRKQADKDAYGLIQENASHPQWALPRYNIEPDPRSRMFDPFNPDKPPMPPDDPASHQFMHFVDGKKGAKHWHANGDTPFVENPEWFKYLPLNEEGVLVLDAGRAMELALLHSREYQRQLQTLYLTALDVSFERFRFDSQFFGGYHTDYAADGPLRSGAGSQSVLTAALFPGARGIRMNKLGTTGTDLVVGFANSLVWQFSGPDEHTASSLIDFAMVQPLLRAGGRARVMEQLTLSERNLLAQVRQMERYRQEFYLRIIAGGPDVARAGGFMGLLQTQQEIHNQEDNLASLTTNYLRQLEVSLELQKSNPTALNTLVQKLQVAQSLQAVLNAENTLNSSKAAYQAELDNFKITLGLPPPICVRIDDPMIEQLRLIDPRIRTMQNKVTDMRRHVGEVILSLIQKETSADPAATLDVGRELDDLKRELDEVTAIHRELTEGDKSQMRRVREDGVNLAKKLERLLAPQQSGEAALLQRVLAVIEGSDDGLQRLQGITLLRDTLADVERFRRELLSTGVLNVEWMISDTNPATRAMFRDYEADLQKLNEAADADLPAVVQQLVARLDRDAQPLVARQQQMLRENPWYAQLDAWRVAPDDDAAINVDPAAELRRMQRLFAQIVDTLIDAPTTFDGLKAKVEDYHAKIDALRTQQPGVTPEQLRTFRKEISPAIPQDLVDLANNILELSLVQARARAENVSLMDVDLHPQAALEIARNNRLDWMNARADLVDAWRLIRFTANDLKSTVDVVFSGDVGTRDNKPLKFDANTGRLRVAVQFDAPLTRLSERNTYRETLIQYQQARMAFYAYEDEVARDLRATIRNLQLNQRNFQIRRAAVFNAARQIVFNDAIQRKRDETAQAPGATTARDAVSALTDLLNAQNSFLRAWVDYEVQRRTLDYKLGTMQLDSESMWVDPGEIGPDQGYPGIGDSEECWPGPMDMPTGSAGAGEGLEVLPAPDGSPTGNSATRESSPPADGEVRVRSVGYTVPRATESCPESQPANRPATDADGEGVAKYLQRRPKS